MILKQYNEPMEMAGESITMSTKNTSGNKFIHLKRYLAVEIVLNMKTTCT